MKDDKKKKDYEDMEKMKNKKGKEEGSDEDDKKKKVKKSLSESDDLTEDDLEKSLEKLTDFVADGDPATKKQALLEKAQKGELDDLEKSELFGLLGGSEEEPGSTLSDEVEKSMDAGEDMQKALDVSSYLDDSHKQLVEACTTMAKSIDKSDSRQHDFNMLLAKSTAQIGKLVKSVSATLEAVGERIGVIEAQPAGKPRSQGKALNKSFAGVAQPNEGNQLNKSEVLEEMNTLFEKSIDSGQGGWVDGVDIGLETTKYEQSGQLNPQVLGMIKEQLSAAR